MAWDRRDRSSSRRGRAAAMKEVDSSSSLQPWACSSLSSSEKFLSLYDKMHDKMQEDWEKENFESLVNTRCLLQAPPPVEEPQFHNLRPPTMMERPGSMIVFPRITSRGSLVGKKVYCRTSIHSSVTWRQNSSTQRMRTSMMILNFYQDRSSSNNTPLAVKQTTRRSRTPADSATTQSKEDHSLDEAQCRALFLSLAGAAGMRLLCPPLQLPLLEILLFFRRQLSSKNRGGLWRLPVNLALASVRPFCGSLVRRFLTALLCIAQMRIKKNNITIEQGLRYMPGADLYSVVFEKELRGAKEFTICSTNGIQNDDPDAKARTQADGFDRNTNGTLLSSVVVGCKFEKECWSDKGVPGMEILICERESLSEIDNVPNLMVQDEDDFGFDTVCSEDSLFSVVDLELEETQLPSPRWPSLEQKESQGLISARTAAGNVHVAILKRFRCSENGLLASRKRPHVAVEEARNGSFDEFEFEVSFPFTDVMRPAEEEQPEPTSVSLPTWNLKAIIDEPEDESCSPRKGDCNEVAAQDSLDAAPPAGAETVENQIMTELQDGESVLCLEGESADGISELELEVCPIVDRIGGCDCVLPERLQEQTEVFLSEGIRAETELQEVKSGHCVEETSGNRVLGCTIEEHTIGGSDCVSAESLEGQIDDFIIEKTGTGNELERAVVTVPEEQLAIHLIEAGEYQDVKNIHELEFEDYLEGLSMDGVLDCPIDELIESLIEQTEVFLSRTATGIELEKDALTVPVEELSLALTEAVEDQGVRDIEEVKSTHSVEEKLAERIRDQKNEGCPIQEHPIGGSDCVSPERLQELTGFSLFETTSPENELEEAALMVPPEMLRHALADVPENEDVKDIQEVKFTHPAEEKSVLGQELEVYLIEEDKTDDKKSVSSEGLQAYSAGGFLSERATAENEVYEKEALAAGAVTVPAEKSSLGLTEGVENETVMEVHEVKSTLFEEEESEELFELDLKIWSTPEPRVGHSDCALHERAQSLSDISLSDWISAENDLEKGPPPAAALSVPAETQSSASTELFQSQAVKEIQEVKSTEFVEENSAERALNHALEFCPVEGRVSSERWQLPEVEALLPETTSAENELEKESSQNLRGHFELAFDGEAIVSEQDDEISYGSDSSQDYTSGEEDDLPSSPMTICATADDDSQSEDSSSEYHSDAISTKSGLEYPESNLTSWTGASLLEPSALTSLTSRPNIATEAGNDAPDSHNGAIPLVTDEISIEQKKDEHIDIEATVKNVTISDSMGANDRSELPRGPTETETVVGASLSTALSPRDEVADEIRVKGDDHCLPGMCAISSPMIDNSSTEKNGVPESCPEHDFADHPTCVELRELRHSHGDQTYIDIQELLPPPWGQLIFWHGRCKEGRPTLCVLLGKAVRQLPGHELKHFIAVTVSHLEHAELNFFKGNVKQMNILMDLDGLGFMRLPPMNILSSIGAVLNRDYAGRGGWIILLNAPMMLGFVINAIQGVILRPSKGNVIDSSFKGFLDGKEKIMMLGSKYRPVLQKHFDTSMLPDVLGGDCSCISHEDPCKLGIEFLELPWNSSSHI